MFAAASTGKIGLNTDSMISQERTSRMWLKTLKSEDASPAELAAAHVELETKLNELNGEREEAYNACMALQLDQLGGASSGKKLKDVKERLADFDQKIEAIQSSMETLRERLKERVRTDSEIFTSQQYNAESEALLAEKKEGFNKFLAIYAKAIVAEELLEGVERNPSLRFDETRLNDDQRAFLIKEVKRLRESMIPAGFVTPERRLRKLWNDHSAHERILCNPNEEAERLLRSAGSRFFEEPEAGTA